MPRIKFSPASWLSNLKAIVLLMLMTLMSSALVLHQTPTTGAFIRSSLQNIKMGIGTDNWQPPQPPQILGYTLSSAEVILDSEAAFQLQNCGTTTTDQEITLYWQDSDAETANIRSYFLGTSSEPYLYELDRSVQFHWLVLKEGLNQYQVISLDNKDRQSEPSLVCEVVSDTIEPVVNILQPGKWASSGQVTVEAEIAEVNLATAQVVIRDEQGIEVAVGGQLSTVDGQEELNQISFEWAGAAESGEYLIEVTASDKVGHSVTQTITVTIDTQSPQSLLTMQVPTTSDNGYFANGDFAAGLQGWTVVGDVLYRQVDGDLTSPSINSTVAILGASNQADQVSVLTQDLSTVADQVDSVGFWYYLNPSHGANDGEGMMVFVGEQLVHQEWLFDQPLGWKYLQLDVSTAIDPSVTVTYYHDQDPTTGGELYVDGFTTNQSFTLADINFQISSQDNLGQAQIFATYLINGQEIVLSGQDFLEFKLATLPDQQQFKYWAVDDAGNQEQVKTFTVPVLTKVDSVTDQIEVALENDDQTTGNTNQNASSSGNLEPFLILSQADDNNLQILLENLTDFIRAEYTLIYSHTAEVGGEEIQEAVLNGFDIAVGTALVTDDVYLGTCSSSAGIVCVPHLNITNASLELKLSNGLGELIQLQAVFDGVWTNPISAQEDFNHE